MLVTRKKQPIKNERAITSKQTSQHGVTETKGTKGIFGISNSSLNLFNSDKTFLFKAGTSQKSDLVIDKEMKARENSVHNTLKDRVEIHESCLGKAKAPLWNGSGYHSNQVDRMEKKKDKVTRSSREKKSASPKGVKNLKRSSPELDTKSSTLLEPNPTPHHGSSQQKTINPPFLELGNMAQEQSYNHPQQSNCLDPISFHRHNG